MSADIILNNKTLDFIGEKINLRKDNKTTTKPTAVLDPVNGNLQLGHHGADGDLLIYGKTGKKRKPVAVFSKHLSMY